jgi:hypothetical protein
MPLHISVIGPFIPAEARLRFWTISCGICGGQSGTGLFGFLQSVSFYLCPILIHSFFLSFISNRRYIILVINNIIEDHTCKIIAVPSGGYTEAVEVNSMVLQPQYLLAITCTFNVVTSGCQAVLFRTSLGTRILGWLALAGEICKGML